MSTDDVPEFTCAAVRERPLVVKSKKEIVERVCGESSGCRPDMHRRTKVDMCDILRDRIGNFSRGFQNARSHNGRFLRHRPERSGRWLNYRNCTIASPRGQTRKVCRRPSVKTMLCDRCTRVRHPLRCALNHHRETFGVSGIFYASCASRIARRPRRCRHYGCVETHRQIQGCCIRQPCVEH